ncbi:MAG: ATP-binding protein [Terrimicrobiaceae bacterium]
MKPAIRIALMYALLSGLYIVLSDWAARQLTRGDSDLLTQWQSMKGLAFVAASAVMIFFLVYHYVRSRDHTQELLEQALDSFEQLFRRNPLPVLVYDTASLRVLAVNDAAVEEYGYKREEFLRLTLAKLHGEEDFDKLLAHVSRIKPYPYTGQWRHVRADGSGLEAEITSHPIVFSGCQARLAVAMNISARKVTERAMAEAFAAKTEAEEAKTRFLSTISHEMRTPLNAVMGYLDLLAREQDSSRRPEFIAIAQRSADDLLALIQRLIDAATLHSRKVPGDRREVELDKFLRGVVDGFFKSAVSKSIKLDFRCDAPLAGKAVLDVLRIEETLQILVGNAIKFSNGGTVEIGVRQKSAGTGALLELSVADEGIGIPEAQQARVFDSFFQVDQNLTRKYGGAGMGLFVAKQLCDLMGASLGVESQDGAGSTFTVSLPGKIDAGGRFIAGDEPDGPAENASL